MNGSRHHLFAGPGFAQDQHVGIFVRHLLDQATYTLDSIALADQQPQQGLTMFTALQGRMHGGKRLAEMEQTGHLLIGTRRLDDPDKIAGRRLARRGTDKRNTRIGREQLLKRAAC